MMLKKNTIFVRNFLNNFVTNKLKRHFNTSDSPLYAGHSKWANIKHIKAEKDGQKATLFTRLSRQIRLAIQEGGSPDPSMNTQLRSIIDEALRKNMPMATIQNNINKFQQSKNDLKKYLVEIRYKQKVFVICIVYTDKFAGFKMELAPIVRKAGAIFADSKHLFEDIGLIEAILDAKNLPANEILEERATNDAIECGAEDVEVVNSDKGAVNFICCPLELNSIKKYIETKGYQVEKAEHVFVPKNVIELTNEELLTYELFVRKLKEMPGLEDVYDNVLASNS